MANRRRRGRNKPKNPSEITQEDVAKALGEGPSAPALTPDEQVIARRAKLARVRQFHGTDNLFGSPTLERECQSAEGFELEDLAPRLHGKSQLARHRFRAPMTLKNEIAQQILIAAMELAENGDVIRNISAEIVRGKGVIDNSITEYDRDILTKYVIDHAIIERGPRVCSNENSAFYREVSPTVAYSRMAAVDKSLPRELKDFLFVFAEAVLGTTGSLPSPTDIGKIIAATSDRNRAAGAYIGVSRSCAWSLRPIYEDWARNQKPQMLRQAAHVEASV